MKNLFVCILYVSLLVEFMYFVSFLTLGLKTRAFSIEKKKRKYRLLTNTCEQMNEERGWGPLLQ